MNTKYLDKVVEYLIDDTVVDYEQKLVTYSWVPDYNSQWGIYVPLSYVQYESPFFLSYSKYCKDMYGLTEDEVKYVWDEYKNLMLIKCANIIVNNK